MVVLKVSRDSGYADSLRAYAVVLDDKKIGELRNGETKEFSIPPGPHKLSLKIDWCGSRALNVTATEGKTLSFRASSNLRGLRLLLNLWYIIFARNSYLLIEQASS
jgi:hypothetical protein